MPWYPKAIARQISRNYTAVENKKNLIVLHSTASASATSQFGWFNNPLAKASSHFHVANDGTIEQYLGTDYMSWCNKDGNRRSVTIETQGTGNEPWTPAQMKALASLIDWISKTHNIPVRMVESSHSSQSGIGWHRIGIDGNFPKSGLLRGRSSRGGGELWSGARGKACPGDKRILQVPELIKMVEALRAPAAPTAPAKPSTSSPAASAEHDTYTVVKGDTLWKIATTFKTNVRTLTTINNLKTDLLTVGQKLKVPSHVYTVKAGDTLWGVSRKHGTTVNALKKLNGLKSDLLEIGQKLKTK